MSDYYLDQIVERERAGEKLTEVERNYQAVYLMMWDVCNGGFHQYFQNSSGDSAPRALDMFQTVGEPLEYAADILKKAMAVLPTPYEIDTEKRRGQLQRLSKSQIEELEAIEHDVFDYQADIEVGLYEWAAENEELFPDFE